MRFIIAAALCGALLAAPADAGELTADDVIALVEAGLSPKTIQTQIDVMGARLTFDAKQIIRLKKAGADEAWIRRLIRTGAPRPAPAASRLARQVTQVASNIGPVYRRHPAVGNSMTYGLPYSGRPWFWPYHGYGYGYGYYGYGGPHGYSVPLRDEQPIQFYTDNHAFYLKDALRLGLGYTRPIWHR